MERDKQDDLDQAFFYPEKTNSKTAKLNPPVI